MKGNLIVVRQGVNVINGVTVFSDATTTDTIHSSWFNSAKDVRDFVQSIKDDSFVSACWQDADGTIIDIDCLL